MDKPKFVYVIFIQSTPEKVWNALIEPEVTKRYWGNHHNASDWKAGSRWEHRDYDDASRVDIVGAVIESTPPSRLAVTWVPPADQGNSEKESRVAFDVIPFGDSVCLKVTHDELEPDSEMLEGVAFGWPIVMSCLKTLLETNVPMPMGLGRPS